MQVRNQNLTALLFRIKTNNVPGAIELISKLHAKHPECLATFDNDSMSLLAIALETGAVEIAEHLFNLQKNNRDILYGIDARGRTIFHIAVTMAKNASYKNDENADERKNKINAANRRLNIVRILFDHVARNTIPGSNEYEFALQADSYNRTPLHMACYLKNLMVVELLLQYIEKCHAKNKWINYSTNNLASPLDYALKTPTPLSAAKLIAQLINHGATINDWELYYKQTHFLQTCIFSGLNSAKRIELFQRYNEQFRLGSNDCLYQRIAGMVSLKELLIARYESSHNSLPLSTNSVMVTDLLERMPRFNLKKKIHRKAQDLGFGDNVDQLIGKDEKHLEDFLELIDDHLQRFRAMPKFYKSYNIIGATLSSIATLLIIPGLVGLWFLLDKNVNKQLSGDHHWKWWNYPIFVVACIAALIGLCYGIFGIVAFSCSACWNFCETQDFDSAGNDCSIGTVWRRSLSENDWHEIKQIFDEVVNDLDLFVANEPDFIPANHETITKMKQIQTSLNADHTVFEIITILKDLKLPISELRDRVNRLQRPFSLFSKSPHIVIQIREPDENTRLNL